MMTERVTATYWIETAFPLAQAAETMAGEQSTGTFVRVWSKRNLSLCSCVM